MVRGARFQKSVLDFSHDNIANSSDSLTPHTLIDSLTPHTLYDSLTPLTL